jgi:hypothetical protein
MIVRRPGFIEPCLPSKVARPPSGPLWVDEIDRGYRAGAYRNGGDATTGCVTHGRKTNYSMAPAMVATRARLLISFTKVLAEKLMRDLRRFSKVGRLNRLSRVSQNRAAVHATLIAKEYAASTI